jgi:predicted kinase
VQRFIMLAGMPGSGKSTRGRELKLTEGVFVVSTDGLRLALNADVYPRDVPGGDYAVLDPVVFALAEQAVASLLKSGHSVALDATCLSRARRAAWAALARRAAPQVRVEIHWCTGNYDSAERWERERGIGRADYEWIIAKLKRGREVPTADEADVVLGIPDPTLAEGPPVG